VLAAQSAVPLAPGVPVERRLTPGQVHRASVRLSSGQFFHLAVEQAHFDLAVPGFPQFGHGSIKLSILFNDPTDKE
jgi:hypothetical protein